MGIDLAALRAAYAKRSESSGQGNTGFWDKFYPFYKMDFNQTAEFRFLLDKDPDNPLGFIVENRYHEFEVNGNKKKVACLRMYDEDCPCCKLSKKFYDSGDEKMGKKFWRKIDYIAQGLIISTPFEYPIKEEDNPVRMVSMTSKLYKRIEHLILNSELDDMPTDVNNGYDFKISKTKQGEYADYSNSDFKRKATPISADLQARMKPYDLKDYRFGKIEREQIEAMLQAALTGGSYDDNKEKAAATEVKETRPAEEVVAQAASAQAPQPAAAAASPATDGKKPLSPQEILAKYKARTSA